MGEQQAATELSKCPHPEAVGKRWGDPISDDRRKELTVMLDTWRASPKAIIGAHGERQGPFSGVPLTGADVFWLAVQARSSDGWVLGLPLVGADLHEAHLEGARLTGVGMIEADLHEAHLEGANLSGSILTDAALYGAHLAKTILWSVDLQGVNLSYAELEGANLIGVWVNSSTLLIEPTLDHTTKLGDIQWSGVGTVNLTRMDWERVPTLGDEQGVRLGSPASEHAAILRAYRQVAAQLRAQGMNEVADRFAYRAQVRQRWAHLSAIFHDWRRPWRWPGDLARYLGSLFLAVLAGYGYRPGRTLFWYVMTVLSFMGGYWLVTHGAPLFGLTEPVGTQPLRWYEALVLSLASFHERGFFPQGISLGDPVAILAACEAVIGLFVEISFIATFTQRYFGAK